MLAFPRIYPWGWSQKHMLAWMKAEPDNYNVARIGRKKNEYMSSWFASPLMQNRKAGLLMRRIGWRNMMIIAIGFKNHKFNDNSVQYVNHGISSFQRIHMTGSRLYDCIIRACEHDDDIDDACNGCSAGYNEQSIEKPITSLIMIHSYAINMIFNTIF